MASRSRKSFDQNTKDVERLIEIHGVIGGGNRGRRVQLEVLNKSAIVLITALWEAYCEDLAAEALKHVVKHATSAEKLAKELRRAVARELEKDLDECACWRLADDGWRDVLEARLESLRLERNRKLNTPKAKRIDELFESAIGLEEISKKWHWTNMSVKQACNKLDRFVGLRGDVAHRGAAARGITKDDVTEYLGHVSRLVAKTGGGVNGHVRSMTGRGLW